MPNAFIPYLKLFRFPLVFTAIADSAAGYLVAARRDVFDPRILAQVMAASAGLYFFGMALNDIADRKRDLKIAPNRMLPSGRMSLRGAMIACLLVLLASAVTVIWMPGGGSRRMMAWGGAVACILAYDLFLKVPPVMGLVRAFNFLLGMYSAVQGPLAGLELAKPSEVLLATPSFIYGTALTLVSTLEEGMVHRKIVFLGAAFMAIGATLPAMHWVMMSYPSERGLWGLVPGGILAGWVLLRASRASDRKGVMLLVRDGVAGFILLDSAQLAAAGKMVPAAAIAALLLPAALSVAWFKKLA